MPSEISRLLRQRGHDVTKEGGEQDILLPSRANDSELISSFKVVLYNLMRRDEVRKELRNWAFGNLHDQNSNRECVEAYVALCAQFGGFGDQNPDARQMRYAKTFEWYISELLRREFAARASGFGLRLKDAHPSDEFDCVALLDEGIVFVECKTGRSEIYRDVVKFMRRDAELSAVYSFYLFDRDYTFQRQGDDVPKLDREQARDLGILGIFQVSVGSHRFFEILDVPGNQGFRYLLACSAFDGLEHRIRYMIRYCNEDRAAGSNRSQIFERREVFCYGPDPKSIGR